jgi:predicted 2-oxoglutarate/Fe(II)-dependent dioxygenase YbiX
MYREDVLVQHNAIGESDLHTLMDYVQRAELRDSIVSNEAAQDSAETQWVVDKTLRDTQEVQLSHAMVAKLVEIERALVGTYINPFFGVEVRDGEPWQILHYGVGGHYIPHVDAETLFKDDDGLDLWEKTLDRDLSVVCFLNDDIAGGELVFPDLDLSIAPRAGTLVCFPSDHNFIHGVNPVRAGHRYTLVSWLRILGMPTPDEINEQTMDEYHRQRPRQIQQRSRVGRAGRKV